MPEPKNTQNKQVDPAQLKLASQLAGNLFGMLKAVHLYPKGHQMLLQVLEKFFNHLNYVLAEKQSATFHIFESKLYVLGVCLPHDKPPGIEEFIEELQKRYVRQIIFNLGVTITDITALVEVLNTDPEQLSKDGGASVVLGQGGAQATHIIEYYYRRHSSIDEERLLAFTNSDIFRFFTDEMVSLDLEQASMLYDLLKEPRLISALSKAAAQYMLREKNIKLSESQLILNIINRIKTVITNHGIAEEAEMQVILKDVVSSFNAKDLLDLIFENPDDDLINYTYAIDSFAEQADSEMTARLLTDKISDSKEDSSSIIAHTKSVLGRLFVDRQSFINFLPVFKERLQADTSAGKAKNILNDICSAFAPGFSLEDDVELALGTISDAELQDIVNGLNLLKSVHVDKQTLEKTIVNSNVDASHIYVLQALLTDTDSLDCFKKALTALIEATKGMLQHDQWDKCKQMFSFFTMLARTDSLLPEEYRNSLVHDIQAMPALLIQKLMINILFDSNPDDIRNNFEELFPLLGEKLISLLVKLYAREENLPQAKLIRTFILEHYTPNIFKLDLDLRRELTPNMMRLIDLLQQVKTEDTLPILWEITFHENAILAQRALKLIAIRGSETALTFLLKTLSHPQFHIQIAGIEYLGSYRFQQVRSALLPIARGQTTTELDETTSNDLRTAALRSLLLLDKSMAREILVEILKKKRWFLFPIEAKTLRMFAKEQIKKLRNK